VVPSKNLPTTTNFYGCPESKASHVGFDTGAAAMRCGRALARRQNGECRHPQWGWLAAGPVAMTAQAPIIGIDLGTTFSAVAFVNEKGVPEIICNREGERITPSVVLFDGDSPIVGTIAKAAALTAPLNVVQFVKRQMGVKEWKFRTDGGATFTPEEISALILKRLKDDAEVALGEFVSDAVITVPAYFNDAQRQATKDAGRIAGLNVIRMINEPTAAALAYGLKQEGPVQTVMIYDLGGGTFDVTILRIGGGEISVIATGGDKNLGGFDWDNVLMSHLNEQFKAAGGPDLLDDPEQESNLRAKCELAKKTLSSRDKASVLMNVRGKSITAQVTREHFEEITKTLFKRTISIMEFVLEDAKLSWKEISKILLVGGSTRMRGVPRWISEASGISPSAELHPDEVVAFGAAIQGVLCRRDAGEKIITTNNLLPVLRVTDVNSHSLGVVALNEDDVDANSIIIPKNTTVPCQASDTFRTVVENQRQIRVRVTQGEDENIQYVEMVGEATVSIPPYPKGAPIEIIFDHDLNGQILVSVKDLTTHKMLDAFSVVLTRDKNLPPEMVEQRRIALASVTVN